MPYARILYRSFYWRMLQFFVSCLIIILLARSLQSAVTAELYSLVYLLSLAVSFFTFGLDIGLNFFISKKEISAETAQAITITVIIAALVTCLPILYFLFRPVHYPDFSLVNFIFFSALYITGGLLSVFSGAIFTAHHKNHLPSIVSFVVGAAAVISILVANRFHASSGLVHNLFLIYFLSFFFQGLIMFIYSCRLYGKKLFFGFGDGTPFAKIIRFSLAAFLVNFIFFLGSRLSVLLLPYWVAPAALGNFIMAFKIVEYVQLIAAFFYYPFIAIVAGQSEKKIGPVVLMLVRISHTCVLLFVLCSIIGGNFLFSFILGGSFNKVYGLFIGFMPGLFAACSSNFFTAYYFGTGKLRYNLTSACILLLGMFLFLLLFFKMAGLAGAAVAFSLASLLSLIYDALIFRRYVHYSLWDILFVNQADRSLIASFFRRMIR